MQVVVEADSVGGIQEEVLCIVREPKRNAPVLRESLVVQLEGYTGSVDPRYDECVPIAPVETASVATLSYNI